MTIDRSRRFYAANSVKPNTRENGHQKLERLRDNRYHAEQQGTTVRREMNGWTSEKDDNDDAVANTATRRTYARACITKNHQRRMPASVRASVVLLL